MGIYRTTPKGEELGRRLKPHGTTAHQIHGRDEAVGLAASQKNLSGPVRIRKATPSELRARYGLRPPTAESSSAEYRQMEFWARAGFKSTHDPDRVREA